MQKPEGKGLAHSFGVMLFFGVFMTVGGFVNSFHLHGWKWVALALPISLALFGAGWLVVKRVAASTHNAPRPRSGNRAARRSRRN